MNIQSIPDIITVAPAVGAANLTMYPLLLDRQTPAGYVTLDEALANKSARVTEVSESGHVPELTITNDGAVPVLVLDGEELVGAKQNRIVNLTVMVPAHTRLPLPVACVEAGRWAHRTRAFAAAGRAHYATGRAMKLHQVTRSMEAFGERRADQGAIWADIDEKAARMSAHSETHAAAAMYDQAREALDQFQARLEPLPSQVGAVFAINGAIVGLELFDSPETWRKSMRKVVESYGLDALDRRDAVAARPRSDPKRFLRAVCRAEAKAFPAVGLGEDLRLESPRLAGAALTVDQEVVHLLAYAC
jgi:hypothetical protein